MRKRGVVLVLPKQALVDDDDGGGSIEIVGAMGREEDDGFRR